jgi:hypothetical protein
MNDDRRPIDDPEVRAQHRRQFHRNLRQCVVAVAILATFLATPPALMLWAQYVLADRVPATVEVVERARRVVTVSSSDADLPVAMRFEVHDATDYSEGDRVNVVVLDNRPIALEREPLLPLLFAALRVFGKIFVVGFSIGAVGALCLAWLRRRALRRPWQRIEVVVSRVGNEQVAHIAAFGEPGGWELADAPDDLIDGALVDAQIAGTTQRRVIRFYGTRELARARYRDYLTPPTTPVSDIEDQPTGVSAISAPRCTSVGVSDPRSSSSCLASRK